MSNKEPQVPWFRSISTTLLVWFLLLSLPPVLVVTYIGHQSISHNLKDAASAELKHTAPLHIQFINNWFNYRKADIISWSEKEVTVHFMQALEENYQHYDKSLLEYTRSFSHAMLADAYQTDFVKLMTQYDYIYDLFFIDTQGNILYTVAKENDLGTNLKSGPYASTLFAKAFEQSMDDGKVHFSDLQEYAPSGNEIYGFLTVPIIDELGEIIGVFALQIKPDKIFSRLKNNNTIDTAHYLAGADGLLRSNFDTSKQEILHYQVSPYQMDRYTQEHKIGEIKSHEEPLIEYIGLNEKSVLGMHTPIDILGVKWLLVSEIDKDVVQKVLFKLARETTYIIAVTIFLIFIAAFFIARRLTSPLLKLTHASEAMASDKERIPVSVTEKNEIGLLASSFNQMLVDLNKNETIALEQTKQAQKTLHELQEQKFALDAHSIIAITDPQGKIVYANQKFCDISGYSKNELLGQDHRILNSGLHPKAFWKELYDTITRGLVWHNEVRNRAKDGTFYWVDTSIIPFTNEESKIESYIAIRTDITEQKRTEERLIQAKEDAEAAAVAKSAFLASMSHEIRTPMNGVLGMLGLLKNSPLTPVQAHQLSLAQSSAHSLLTLINDILDFSKIEAGKLDIEALEFNLRDELGDFAEAIAFRAQEKGIELILDVKDVEHMQIISDPGRLRQILTNLVGNAIKFTHKGEILIHCHLEVENATEGRLSISVKDSGIGIPENKIATLFDSFTQVDTSTTRKYGGTGLGLSIAKKLVELMGGSITVESKEGQGSVFSFNVSVGLSKAVSLVIPRVDVKGKRVLIVDDNAINREVLHSQLEHWGMKVYDTQSADEALLACAQALDAGDHPPFDVILIDMHMPLMDGAELGKRIREIKTYDAMKMVMMTSLGLRQDAHAFAQIGFNAFFPKPTTTKDLFNALNVLIDDSEILHKTGILTKDNLHTMHEPKDILSWPEQTRILLVEDNMTNQIVANGILEEFNLSADVANDGEEALHALRTAHATKPYTLVLMDCQMPVMDGYSATEAIRRGEAGDENRNIVIIAMTANAMKGDKEHCIASGMDDYISKPINAEILKEVLMKWLSKEEA